jgi:hypothetical protein
MQAPTRSWSRSSLALAAVLAACSRGGDARPIAWSSSATVLAPSSTRPAWQLGRLGSDGFDSVAAVAAMPDGGLAIAGHFEEEIALGSDQLVSAGETDAFVAVLDADGQPRWAERLGGPGFDAATAVVVGKDGGPIVIGQVSGSLLAGDRSLTTSGDSDIAVAAFSPDGAIRWATTLGGPGWDTAAAAALTAAGDLAIAGTSGAGERRDQLAEAGDADVLVALVGPRGRTRWTRRFGGPDWDQAFAIAAAPGGELAVGGAFTGRLEIDGTGLVSAGRSDGFLVRLAPAGRLRDAQRLGGAGDDAVTAVAVARDGSTTLAGHFADRVQLGGAELESAGDSDLFVARSDPDGRPLWAIRAGGAGPDSARALVALPGGSLLVAGDYSLALELVAGSGPSEVILHQLDARGTRRDLLRLTGFFVSAHALAATADGTAVLVGSFAGRARVEGRVIEARDALDGFFLTTPLATWGAAD